MNTVTDAEYERRVRAKEGKRHHHAWVHWNAWDDWEWNPHHRTTSLLICDVPGCIAVRVELST